MFCHSLATNTVTPKGVARAVRLGSHQIHTACVWQRMCVCVRAAPLDTEDKDISELGAARRREITDVRACVTSKQEGFAGVVKPGHLGNSIGGIGQVKFIDDVNLVVLIRSKSQS